MPRCRYTSCATYVQESGSTGERRSYGQVGEEGRESLVGNGVGSLKVTGVGHTADTRHAERTRQIVENACLLKSLKPKGESERREC